MPPRRNHSNNCMPPCRIDRRSTFHATGDISFQEPSQTGLAVAENDRKVLLHQAASRMRDVDYSLRDFHRDMVICFPELVLYLVGTGVDGLGTVETSENLVMGLEVEVPSCDDGVVLTNMTGSGRTGIDEYKRTIGALFAVYWLMRLQARR